MSNDKIIALIIGIIAILYFISAKMKETENERKEKERSNVKEWGSERLDKYLEKSRNPGIIQPFLILFSYFVPWSNLVIQLAYALEDIIIDGQDVLLNITNCEEIQNSGIPLDKLFLGDCNKSPFFIVNKQKINLPSPTKISSIIEEIFPNKVEYKRNGTIALIQIDDIPFYATKIYTSLTGEVIKQKILRNVNISFYIKAFNPQGVLINLTHDQVKTLYLMFIMVFKIPEKYNSNDFKDLRITLDQISSILQTQLQPVINKFKTIGYDPTYTKIGMFYKQLMIMYDP